MAGYRVVGGAGGGVVEAFSDSISLQINVLDGNDAPADLATFLLNANYSDSNAAQTETLRLDIQGLGDENVAPTDASSFTLRVWLSASAGTDVSNAANANGPNDAANAVVSTAALASNPEVMTSALGSNLPSGVALTDVIYRGWFRAQTTLITSTAAVIARSTSGLFADVTMFTQSSLGGDTNHLGGTFTFDLIAAGIDTLAKLQSLQILHRCNDAVAGVTPAVLTVDAGCLEIAGAFTASVNRLSISDATVSESAGTVTVTVMREDPNGTPTSVNYATSNRSTAVVGDTAIVGEDYTATSGSVSFTGFETSKTFTVPILNNNFSEPDRQFVVNLSSPVGGGIGDASAVVVITDDEAAKTFLQDYTANGKDVTVRSASTDEACPTAKFGNGRRFGVNSTNDSGLRRLGDTAFRLLGSASATYVFAIHALPGTNETNRLLLCANSVNGTDTSFQVAIGTGGAATFQHSLNGVFTQHSFGTLAVGLHTLTVVRDNTAKTIVVKVDGVQVLSTTYSGSITEGGTNELRLCSYFSTGQNLAQFSIYDCRIWNTVITQATLDAIVASSGKCKPEGTELAWFRLEDT